MAGIGYGAGFFLHNGVAAAGGALVELAEVFALNPPDEQADDIEVTHFKSPGRTKEYIQGLIDAGEADVSMNYNPGSPTDILIREAKTSGKNRDYKIELLDEDGDIWEITGQVYVKGYKRDIPINDRMAATMTVRFAAASTEAKAS
jgi:hypothetical protein